MRQILILLSAWLALTPAWPASAADWQAEAGDRDQLAAQAAIERVIARQPGAREFLEQAHAIAVLPAVVRGGMGLGGAYGSGIVLRGEQLVGRTRFYQLTSGIQAGGQVFSLLILFRDAAALEEFQRGRIQFLGQASATLATLAAHATPGYDPGVAMFAATRGGLMLEATISGAWLTYRGAR